MTSSIGVASDAPRAFRAIVWKELHESLKIGVAALAVVSVGWTFVLLLERSVASAGVSSGGPSLAVSLFTFTSAIAALMIGRAQIIRERRGDAWAFLTHRPVPRSTLFWGKVLVGVLVYIVAAGLPLALALLWQAAPGHRPLPFDWRMALPYIADFLCGLTYYAAALIISMREARWYGSRYLPIGGALFCSSLVVGVNGFAMAVGIVVLGLVVLGTAARGAFVAGGHYAAQSRASRAALGVTTGVGLAVAGSIAIGIISFVMSIGQTEAALTKSTGYEITSDAEVVQVTSVRHLLGIKSDVIDVKDLAGHPLARYADSASRGAALQAGVISTAAIPLNPNGEYPAHGLDLGYRHTGDLFVQLSSQTTGPSAVSWYFVRRVGLIAAYDNRSARLIGWMGPDGFSDGVTLPAHRFDGALDPYTEIEYKQPLLAFPGAVYHLDLARRAIKKVYTAAPGEVVLGAAGSGDSTAAMTAYGPNAQFDAIATTRSVYVQSITGQAGVIAPRDPRANGYGELVVSRALRAPGAPTVLRYSPGYGTLTDAQRANATEQIAVIGANNSMVAQYTLPRDTDNVVGETEWSSLTVTALTTPMVMRVATSLYDRATSSPRARARPVRAPVIVRWILAILAALASAAFAFGIGRAYAFESDRKRLWAALGLALGPLGVLLMLALIEWPPREVCPACGHTRVVSREHCEHCGAPFGAPALDGTEIFEPAA